MKTMQRILIVDDDDAFLFSYKKLLRGAFVEVDTCMSLEDAIELIRDNDYSTVITDFRLSHSESNEGLEILQYVREHKPSTPVIFLTGYGSDEIKVKAFALGACSYFDKPVQISEIVNALKKLGIPAGES